MRPTEKKIENLIQNLNDQTRPELDRKILDDCLNKLDMQKSSRPVARPNRWRIIMHSRITKQIAAAIIIVAGVFSLTLFNKTVPSAYAIEQTLEAIQQVHTIHMRCKDWDNNEFEMWVELNPKTGIPDYCRAYWPAQGVLDISRPDKSYQYSERSNYVQTNSGKLYHIDIAPAKMFRQIVQLSQMENPLVNITITHEIDSESETPVIVVLVENPKISRKVYIDPDTKLPVRMVGLKNEQLGEFIKDIDLIEYNIELPEGIFDFQIPEGARVFDHDEFGKYLRDPQYGISMEGLSEGEAAAEILTQYWNALILDDFSAMHQVFPSPQPRVTSSSLVAEVVNIGKPYIQNGCGIGKVVACQVRFTDGSLKEFKLIICYRNMNNQPSCVIAGSWGGVVTIQEE